MRYALIPGLVACAILAASALAQPAATPPAKAAEAKTPEDVQKMIDAKSYTPALRSISRLLPPAKPKEPADPQRYTLLMMRGECLVQLKDNFTAIMAYDQAAQAASDLQQNEAARAMSILLRKSPRCMYTPKTGDKTPLDVTVPQFRKVAMQALLNDELPSIESRLKAAADSKSLPPILNLGPVMRDFHALEVAATGEDKQSMAVIQPLADRVHDLIQNEVNRMDEETKSIQRAASRIGNFGGGTFELTGGGNQWVPAEGATGLSNDARQKLREDIEYTNKIGQTCADLTATARKYQRDGMRWQELDKRCRSIAEFATAVYENE